MKCLTRKICMMHLCKDFPHGPMSRVLKSRKLPLEKRPEYMAGERKAPGNIQLREYSAQHPHFIIAILEA